MPDLRERISIDPNVCGGRPCIRGTRMRVRDVLSLLAAGATRGEILIDYATSVWLTIEQFQLVIIGVWLDLGLILRKRL